MSDESNTAESRISGWTSEQLERTREMVGQELAKRRNTPEAQREYERELSKMSDREFFEATRKLR